MDEILSTGYLLILLIPVIIEPVKAVAKINNLFGFQ